MSASTVDLRHVWRGHVQPVLLSLPERTAYVDVTTERGARLRIATAVAGLEGVRPEDVDYRICNVKPARTCIEEGESEDHELRLFEIGWGGDGIVFVREPLILLQQPGPLARLWARTLAAAGRQEQGLRAEKLHKNNANADGREPSRSAINTCPLGRAPGQPAPPGFGNIVLDNACR